MCVVRCVRHRIDQHGHTTRTKHQCKTFALHPVLNRESGEGILILYRREICLSGFSDCSTPAMGNVYAYLPLMIGHARPFSMPMGFRTTERKKTYNKKITTNSETKNVYCTCTRKIRLLPIPLSAESLT